MPVMLGLAAALFLWCQSLEVTPRVVHPGATLVIRTLDREGAARSGIRVEVQGPAGSQFLGMSDAAGVVHFVPGTVGRYVVRGHFPAGAPQVLAVVHVVPRPHRLGYALILTPLGLVLLVWQLRRWRRLGISPAPSPPAA